MQLRTSIRDLLLENGRFLKTLNADPKDVSLLQKSADEISELFLIVVAGEYNSGKSAFINALLGNDFLEMGITPTTDAVTILKFGDSVEKTTIEPGLKLFNFPSQFLKEIRIVDTPGTNAITREHEILTTDFIPQSDIVLFVTSADRSFSESERVFLEKINNWGKKIVFIINKIDILESVDEVNQVIDYVRDNALKLLGQKPKTFALSAKNALNDISSGNANVNFEKVTRFITNELDTSERIQLKLTNPVSVLQNIASSYDEENERNLSLLKEDKRLVSDISSQLELFKEDSLKQFMFRYADIDNTMLEFENRGVEFFDETFRLGRLIDLINKERIQREYRENVIANLEKEIDDKVDGLIHWLVEENFKQWQMVNNKINQRMSEL